MLAELFSDLGVLREVLLILVRVSPYRSRRGRFGVDLGDKGENTSGSTSIRG